MGRRGYLAKNTFIFAIGSLGTKIIAFFLVPLYTNVLTTEEYGIIDLLFTICTVLAPLVILNIGESLMRFPLDKDSDRTGIISTGISIWGIALLITLFAIPITHVVFPVVFLHQAQYISEYSFYLCACIFMLASSQLFLCYLRGKEELLKYSIGNIINAGLIAGFNILFLVSFKLGIKGYFLAYILANLITSIYACIAGKVILELKAFHIDVALTKNMIRYAMVLAPNTFLWWVTNSSDRIMVTALVSEAANGVYAVSYKIPSLLTGLVQIFNQAWSYSAIRENDSDDKEAYSNKVFRGLFATASFVAVSIFLVIKSFLRVYTGKEFYESWKYTPYLVIGFVFLSLGSFLATPYVVEKDGKGFLFSAALGATINILLNLILIPKMKVNGAAVATLLSYVGVFIYRLFDTRKYIRIKISDLKYFTCLFIMIISGVSLFFNGIAYEIIRIICVIVIPCVFGKEFRELVKGVSHIVLNRHKSLRR
ncbi:MAG: oligosaccharide flippase family protein [Lachnospiraceae bacterium]|nr:oligosaccharide flippase family protein [Lachnospiraceae bacterium]